MPIRGHFFLSRNAEAVLGVRELGSSKPSPRAGPFMQSRKISGIP